MGKVAERRIDPVLTQEIYVDKHDGEIHNVVRQSNFAAIAKENQFYRQHPQHLRGDNAGMQASIPYLVWDRWAQRYPILNYAPNSREARRILRRLLAAEPQWRTTDKQLL